MGIIEDNNNLERLNQDNESILLQIKSLRNQQQTNNNKLVNLEDKIKIISEALNKKKQLSKFKPNNKRKACRSGARKDRCEKRKGCRYVSAEENRQRAQEIGFNFNSGNVKYPATCEPIEEETKSNLNPDAPSWTPKNTLNPDAPSLTPESMASQVVKDTLNDDQILIDLEKLATNVANSVLKGGSECVFPYLEPEDIVVLNELIPEIFNNVLITIINQELAKSGSI